MSNPFDLTNHKILITGASSGIGRSIAIACAYMGAQVIITGRRKEQLEKTLSALDGCGHDLIAADLTDSHQRQTLVDAIPRLDGLVQCAGVGSRIPCKMIDEQDINNTFKINTEAPILLQSKLLQEKKIAKGASIVYIASSAATMPAVGNALYSASKGAIISYSKCLAQELAPRQIRVNSVSPAMVWTDLALVGATEEQLYEIEKKYPLQRYGQPEDIANLVVYLLSGASGWMTGSNIEITGGTQVL